MRNEKLVILLLSAVMFVCQVDNYIVAPVLKDIADSFGVAESTLGILISMHALFFSVCSLLAGPLLDRYGRRRIMLIALATFLIANLGCGLAPSRDALLVFRALSGLAAGPLLAGIYAYIGDRIPFERRGKVMGTVISALFLANIIGVPVGAFITGFAGWPWVFYSIAAVSLVLWALLWRQLTETAKPQAAPFDLKSYVGSIFVFFVQRRTLPLLAIYFLLFTAVFGYVTYYATWLRHEAIFGYSVNEVGVIYLVAGVFAFFSSLTAGKLSDRVSKKRLVLVSTLVSAVVTLGHPNFYPALTPILGGAALIFAGNLLISVIYMSASAFRTAPLQTLMSEMVPAESRGRYMASLSFCQGMGIAAGPVWGGWILARANFTETGVGFDLIGQASLAMLLIAVAMMAVFVRDIPVPKPAPAETAKATA